MNRMLIFGAGASGKRALDQYREAAEVIGYCDNDPSKWGTWIEGLPVYAPDVLSALQFDTILVASAPGREAIRTQLHALRIPENKILFFTSGGAGCLYFIKNFSKDVYENKLPGAIVEVGVFRGDTAQILNDYFPDRRLYLFDTFTGFPTTDILIEKEFSFSGAKDGEYSDTSVELVLNKMLYKENIILRKGVFPETAAGIEDRFIFVRLDLDLYQPTLEGLKFFSNRMNHGGVILLHDYYTDAYKGVKQAVTEFLASRTERPLFKFPAGDLLSIALVGF